MCGRYYVDSGTEQKVQELTGDKSVRLRVGDVHPSETATILDCREKSLSAEDMVWGFPGYNGGRPLINARAETITEKNAFKDSVASRRCVIPAKGFYEWSPDKEKYNFEDPGETLFMAGCYDAQNRFVIITTAANKSVLPVHERMPLLLSEEEIEQWIEDMEYLNAILKKIPKQLERWAAYEQMSIDHFIPKDISAVDSSDGILAGKLPDDYDAKTLRKERLDKQK